MSIQRSSGILLHITSLPSRFGIGDLGPEAKRFVDFLARSGQSWWQILPLNPTSSVHGNSPYSSSSAYAGNTLLISPEEMLYSGLLEDQDLDCLPSMPLGRADYDQAESLRASLLLKAFALLDSRPEIRESFFGFCARQAHWLHDYALFMALKQSFQNRPWYQWPEQLRRRDPQALGEYSLSLRPEMDLIRFGQYIFFTQWTTLRRYCQDHGVQLIGDIPIYVNEDSADVWAHPHVFKLDENLRPRVLAGVPPDYFSATGQLWGNPVYDWEQLRADGFSWWLNRIRHNTEMFDLVRLDHFRGFVGCWEVPAGETTAVNGSWVDVPARDFLRAVADNHTPLPLIAEDLGTITDDVRTVMREFGLPGMKILLFAFGPDLPTNPYAPHNHERKCVVYTGTHDNNTVRGWFEQEADQETRARLEAYLGVECKADNIALKMVRLTMQSVADLAIFPLQDLLGMDAGARMNMPGVANGHWTWRLQSGILTNTLAENLLTLTALYGRTSQHP
ncbi:MAG TPA: 4-alpha-glucanotransferase [Desulfonatronum sp.]|nr:4-alpha-glucanotransferase [Desulfonatronum sp.]